MLERALVRLQPHIKSVEDDYGLDNLHLTLAKGYVAKLLGNAEWFDGSPRSGMIPRRILGRGRDRVGTGEDCIGVTACAFYGFRVSSASGILELGVP